MDRQERVAQVAAQVAAEKKQGLTERAVLATLGAIVVRTSIAKLPDQETRVVWQAAYPGVKILCNEANRHMDDLLGHGETPDAAVADLLDEATRFEGKLYYMTSPVSLAGKVAEIRG
jgi:hypothetical protein